MKNFWFRNEIKAAYYQHEKSNNLKNWNHDVWKNSETNLKFEKCWKKKKTKNEKRKKKTKYREKSDFFFDFENCYFENFFFSNFIIRKNSKFFFFKMNKWMIDSWNKICSKFQSISWIISQSCSQFKMRILKFLQNKTQSWIVSNEKNAKIYHDQKCDIKVDVIKCNDICQKSKCSVCSWNVYILLIDSVWKEAPWNNLYYM